MGSSDKEEHMQLKEIVSAVPALGKLAAANLRLKTAYELKKTADILQKEVDFFEQERRKIVEKYGTVREDGAVLIPAEQRAQADEEYARLLSMEVQPDFSRLQISISEEAKLAVNDLAALAPFADFIEHEEE